MESPSTPDAASSRSIEIPVNFPVAWEQPDDAGLFWMHDRLHWPEPVTPLDGDYYALLYEHGVAAGARAYEVPVRLRARRINAYFYFALVPPAEEGGQASNPTQDKLRAAMGRLGEAWDGEYLPEIKRNLAYWEAFDLRAASARALLAHLDETVVRMKRLFELHFVIWFPGTTAISELDELVRTTIGDTGGATSFDAYRLLDGFDNKTYQTGRALWRLSQRGRASAEVRRVLEREASAGVIPALEQSAAGRAFLGELRAYLDRYGHRGKTWTLSSPFWIEDPTPVIDLLKDYATQPDRDLDANLAGLAAERERALAQTRARLRACPAPVVAEFEFLLKAAQIGTVLSEDHGFWIDFRAAYQIRRVLLACGCRLAEAGELSATDDVFYLTFTEIRAALAALALQPRDQGGDWRRLVAGRQAEMAYFGTIAPPPAAGTPPAGPPSNDPVVKVLGKFFGQPPESFGDPTIVRGSGGSPGRVTGPAKVVRSLAEARKLRPGEILVTETTTPAWTLLFASVAAVVTDTGGILSHCAVVAREYQIPAVVGTANGTAVIRDGQVLEVDGTEGIVRIVR